MYEFNYSYYDFNNVYIELCEQLLQAPVVGNTRELTNVTFTIKDISTVGMTIRRPSVAYALGEILWYLRGSNSVDFISKFGSMWERLSDDGLTSNSAYGYIMKYKHGFNQIDKMIELLRSDINSRRAVININVPNINVIETHDEPCTIALQFLARDGKLHCTGIMRSNDIWFGLPYDIICFTTIQKIIADALGLDYGTYTHFATSLHMYERDENKVLGILKDRMINCITLDHSKLLEHVDELYECVNNADDAKQYIVNKFNELGILKVEGDNELI